MRTSDEIKDLAAAMAKAQGEMKAATKDHTNPNFGSKYADLAALWDAAREPLSKNGLSVWQQATYADGAVSVTTRIVHASGQWVEHDPLAVPVTKHKWKNEKGDYEMVYDAHGVGGATTYAKRFSFGAALGLVAEEEDDDGNAATGADRRPLEEMPFHDLRVAIQDAAAELEQRGGGLAEDHIRRASEFQTKDTPPKTLSFEDPFARNVSEKWATGVLRKLRERLIESEPGAAEAAKLFR